MIAKRHVGREEAMITYLSVSIIMEYLEYIFRCRLNCWHFRNNVNFDLTASQVSSLLKLIYYEYIISLCVKYLRPHRVL
jgi:hypothetical protein